MKLKGNITNTELDELMKLEKKVHVIVKPINIDVEIETNDTTLINMAKTKGMIEK